MNKCLLFSVGATAAFMLSAAVADDTSPKCKSRGDLAGPCYQVHGRLNAWNGGPATEKIWVVGTRRLLAVYSRSDYSSVMPKAISDQLNSFDTKIFADFLVCPLEKEKPRVMGYICVESAKNILVERHETIDGHDHVRYEQIPDTQGGQLTDANK